MNELLSTKEVAGILKVSRHAITKKIRSKKIKAFKIGRSYVITKEEVQKALGIMIGEESKREIDNAIKKAINEYKETFKKLSKE